MTFDPDKPKRIVTTDRSALDNPHRDAQLRKVRILGGAIFIAGVVLLIGRWGDPI